MPLLTLFTAPKPFTHPHVRLIQRNAIQSWLQLRPEVEIVLIGNEAGLPEVAREFGLPLLTNVQCNALGTPLVSSIFQLAREHSQSPLLAYVNADVLLMPDFCAAAQAAFTQSSRFLLVGQRWDLDVRDPLDFNLGWEVRLRERTRQSGRLHRPAGSDYFVFPRACFTQMPPFAIGRSGWDNWMIYAGRRDGFPVIDITRAAMVIHQDHDYSHLPGGKPHYHLPESDENVRLAGGKRTMFNLPDVSHRLENGRICPPHHGLARLAREAEIFPLIRLHSYPLAQLAYWVFHPVKAFGQLRGWLQYKLRSRPKAAQ